MRRIRRPGAAWMLAAGLLASVSAAGFAEDEPVGFVRVDNPKLDLGEIRAGDVAVGTFIINNDGQRDFRIVQAKPS